MSLRLIHSKLGFAALAASFGLALAGSSAHATTFTASAGTSDGPVDASATITPGNGSVSVSLTDLEANPRSAGQLLSDIQFTVGGIPSLGTATLTSQSGPLIRVNSDGTFTSVSGNPTHWGVATSGFTITLATAGTGAVGGAPINMIIGPPDSSGVYSNANSSINDGHFSPYIQGTGTFVISDASITSSSTITGVIFSFGTGPDHFVPGTPTTPPSVPEPASLALFGTALAGLGLFGRRRRRT